MGELNCHFSDHKKLFSDYEGLRGWLLKSSARHRCRGMCVTHGGVQAQFKPPHPTVLWPPSPAHLLYFFYIIICFSFLKFGSFEWCKLYFVFVCSFHDRQMVVWRAVCCGCWTTLALRLGRDWWGSGWASPSQTRSEYRIPSDFWWSTSFSIVVIQFHGTTQSIWTVYLLCEAIWITEPRWYICVFRKIRVSRS